MVGVGRDLLGHLVQPSCRSRVTYSRLHRTLSRQVLNISREADSTTCSSAPSPSKGRNSSSCSARTSCASICACCPLSCSSSPGYILFPGSLGDPQENFLSHLRAGEFPHLNLKQHYLTDSNQSRSIFHYTNIWRIIICRQTLLPWWGVKRK